VKEPKNLQHITTQKTTISRKLAIQGFDMVHGSHNTYGLLEFDITNLRKHLRTQRQKGQSCSLFAYFLKAVGKTVEAAPLFNSLVDYRTTTTFSSIDICIPVEISIDGVTENRQYTIRDIANKTLLAITQEIDEAKQNTSQQSGFIASAWVKKLLTSLPRWLVRLLFKCIASNHHLVAKLSGTLFVTSVSMFSSVPGFIIPYSGGPQAVSMAFGSVYKKPMVVDNQIAIREVVSVSAIFNHDLIDGAPAARFINRLRSYLESKQNMLA